MPNTPYLSFCVHSRNDNHGGDMYRRMKACLFGFFEQAERHKLDSEIVLVDWNPPQNKLLLKDAYAWPKHSKYCAIRVIVVPPAVHQRYKDWEKFPIHGEVAKNTALRRGRGKFLLSSCVDDLLSDDLFRFLASGKLEVQKIYLIDRSNVKRAVVRLGPLDKQLAYCQKNILWVDAHQPDGCLSNFKGLPDFWTGGPGDFTLMAKERWHHIRGYPEIDTWSPATDGVVCYMAYLSGATMEILKPPLRLYHIDHDTMSNSREANLLARLGLRELLPKEWLMKVRPLVRKWVPAKTQIERLGVDNAACLMRNTLASDMVNGRRSHIYNDESWGLGEEKLKEYFVTKTGIFN